MNGENGVTLAHVIRVRTWCRRRRRLRLIVVVRQAQKGSSHTHTLTRDANLCRVCARQSFDVGTSRH